jgi:hypothetical protein
MTSTTGRASIAAAAMVVVCVCGSAAQAPRSAQAPRVAAQEDEAKAKPAEQHVTGDVVDRDGKPVPKAEVVFDGPKDETHWTDASGKFAFKGPPGAYKITVKVAATKQQQTFDATIADNALKPSRLTLEPADPLTSADH